MIAPAPLCEDCGLPPWRCKCDEEHIDEDELRSIEDEIDWLNSLEE